ncbi:hypothetical protein NEOLEDRAFT_1081904, partial [Neolentinus lepideus HHB14362 ss-1]
MPDAGEESFQQAADIDDHDEAGKDQHSGVVVTHTRKPGTNGGRDQATLGRFPRHTPPVPLPQRSTLKGLRLPFRHGFDQYEGAPTFEGLLPIPDTVLHYQPNLVYIANQIKTHGWEHFHDYGWRLLPSFFQMFDMGQPALVKDHMMRSYDVHPAHDVLDEPIFTRRGDRVQFADVRTMSMDEMANDARLQDAPNLYVTGIGPDGRYIRVNLEATRKELRQEEVYTICDIDSFIWVGRSPQFKKSVEIYTTPVIRDRAPILKNNHVYVNLLVPQTEEDKSRGGSRSEWYEQRFPLSHIPHLSLGTMGGGSTSVNIYMFFPRMTHKAPFSRFWASLIPSHIQCKIWDELLSPCMENIAEQGDLPFMADRAHVDFKRGNKRTTPTYPLTPSKFDHFLTHLQLGVDSLEITCPEFGSYFFVIENKGSKAQSRTPVPSPQEGATHGSVIAAFNACQTSFDGLDWKHMHDETLGQLFIDIGVTLHPKKEGLVGLWSLESLEASFGASGYLSGTVHHINTLSKYGALQAEQPSSRMERTGVVFRSAYNQQYELLRRHDNSRVLFQDKEMYHRSRQYVKDKSQVLSLLRGRAARKSYGVREEFRVSGQAVVKAAEAIDQQIHTRLSNNAVIWIPSHLWFASLADRVEAIDHVHQELRQKARPNYATMTGLLSYMMQCTVFTPPVTRAFVREALQILSFQANMDRFNMFFLPSLDLRQQNCLQELEEEDHYHVFQELGLPYHKRHVAYPDVRDLPKGDVVKYPLGPTPSWSTIRKALREHPWQIVSHYQWPSQLNRIRDAPQMSIL